MRRRRSVVWLLAVMLLTAAGGTGLVLKHRRIERARAAAVARLPRTVLWVWERPTDLRGLDPADTGVAVFAGTVRLGATAAFLPRRQPVVLPEDIARIAVVRLEAEPGFAAHTADPALLRDTADLLVRATQTPHIAAVQIDFDATRSQRGFYRNLIEQVRGRMPPAMPLSITALASWCSTDDWIGSLPIQEAVPMFFRMEPDRRRVLATAPAYRIQEPLCASSVGVSTRGPWPQDLRHRRVYIFADDGWSTDLSLLPPLRLHTTTAHLEATQ